MCFESYGSTARAWIHQPNLGASAPKVRNGVSDTSRTADSLSEVQVRPPFVVRYRVSTAAQRLLVETTTVPGRRASAATPPYPKVSEEPSLMVPPGCTGVTSV